MTLKPSKTHQPRLKKNVVNSPGQNDHTHLLYLHTWYYPIQTTHISPILNNAIRMPHFQTHLALLVWPSDHAHQTYTVTLDCLMSTLRNERVKFSRIMWNLIGVVYHADGLTVHVHDLSMHREWKIPSTPSCDGSRILEYAHELPCSSVCHRVCSVFWYPGGYKNQSRMACVCTESPVHSFIPPWVTWLSSGTGVYLGKHELKTPPLLL